MSNGAEREYVKTTCQGCFDVFVVEIHRLRGEAIVPLFCHECRERNPLARIFVKELDV